MVQALQNVTFPAGNIQLTGVLARPDGDGPFPAVVIIHEIFGLNDNIRDIARRFAEVGYVALAVDLFAGRNRLLCMFRFFGQLQTKPLNNSSIDDLKASLTYLAEQQGVDSARLGAIGFCMGGGFATAWACTDNRLKVVAPFYGVSPKPIEAVERACPIVGSYPTNDFTTSHARKLNDALERYAVPHDIKLYPGTHHSFFNDQGRTFNAEAAQDSWQRVLAFFSEHIGTTA